MRPGCRMTRVRLGPFLVAVAVFGLGAVVRFTHPTPAFSTSIISAAKDEDEGMAFQQQRESVLTPRLLARSEYEDRLGVIGDGLYPHVNLVEVHQPTTLTLDFPAGYADVGELRWDIMSGTDGMEGEMPTGKQVRVRFVKTGTHSVTVVSSGGDSYQFACTAKYVRREIRDLTPADRVRYFDALSIVYRTSQAEGEAAYGDKFRSAAWLVREHLYGAADRSCDHWHDDAGFLNHHVGITMQFEQSLQAIDARVASNYWDYTIDAPLGTKYSTSIVFDDDWFGSADPGEHDNHVITNGRWAFTPVLKNAREFSNITNPYGLLRSPWNTNAIPYLMRSRYTLGVPDALYQLPTCSDFMTGLEMDPLSFSEVSSALNGGLHGQVHIMLGGHWDASSTFIEKMVANISDMDSSPHISDQFLLGSKFLWRQGFVHCPTDCAGIPETDCVCYCPDEVIKGRSASEILHLTGLLDIEPRLQTLLVDKVGLTFDEILAEMCHVGHPGEMFTSAAPQDPLFWPLHGLSERFVQLIRLLASKNVLTFEETWSYHHVTSVLSDTRVVCDWDAIEDSESFAKPTCVRNTTCPGHRADDVLPFKNLDWVPTGTTFTNEQFYAAISPTNTDLPYVYDKLTSWPACPNNTIIPTKWLHYLN
ncbi:hypothetical protein CTAYLR_009816 [Chrysophaeum taylorii]|uniref:Tyrosinase copper-binding domain-containing protein n=1 Tax=Chrysophaeum taylorii TaxID=2483200 RepID=A0AAD7XH24_9STRA|nr:hypothetical protein CTAYLR_009816 [Chrysophaeum taylorii]